MLRRPKTLRKYHEADETQDASSETNSTPLCNIGLKRKVRGNGTLAEIKKQKMKNIKINNVVNNKSTKQSPNSNKNNNDR